jgi:hypothetical protein
LTDRTPARWRLKDCGIPAGPTFDTHEQCQEFAVWVKVKTEREWFEHSESELDVLVHEWRRQR